MPLLISFIRNTPLSATGRLAGVVIYFAGGMLAFAAPEVKPAAPSAPAASTPAPPMVLPPSFLMPPALAPAPDAAGIQDKPAALEALAAYFDKTPDVVVAEVAGSSITYGMVADNIRDLPPIWGAAPPKQVFDLVLNTLVQIRMLAIKAKELGVDKEPDAQRQVAVAVDRELASLLIKQVSSAEVTDAGQVRNRAQEAPVHKSNDAQKIVENARKPGNLAQAGGQTILSKADYYASMPEDQFMKLAAKHMGEI